MTLFMSSVFSNAPERSVSTLSPKLGSLLPGTANWKAPSVVSSKSRDTSMRSSLGTSVLRPAGFQMTEDASSAAPTKAPPRPSVRALT